MGKKKEVDWKEGEAGGEGDNPRGIFLWYWVGFQLFSSKKGGQYLSIPFKGWKDEQQKLVEERNGGNPKLGWQKGCAPATKNIKHPPVQRAASGTTPR